jgi:hypothetical protein
MSAKFKLHGVHNFYESKLKLHESKDLTSMRIHLHAYLVKHVIAVLLGLCTQLTSDHVLHALQSQESPNVWLLVTKRSLALFVSSKLVCHG